MMTFDLLYQFVPFAGLEKAFLLTSDSSLASDKLENVAKTGAMSAELLNPVTERDHLCDERRKKDRPC